MMLKRFPAATIIVIAASIPAIWLADYALIFRFKAAVASWVSVIMVTAGFIRRHNRRDAINQSDTESITALILTGIAIYSLYPPFIITVLIGAFIWSKYTSATELNYQSAKTESLYWMICAAGFLLMDLCREFTVWDEFRLRKLPALIFILSVVVFIVIRNRPQKI